MNEITNLFDGGKKMPHDEKISVNMSLKHGFVKIKKV